jgi:hypothetical protein
LDSLVLVVALFEQFRTQGRIFCQREGADVNRLGLLGRFSAAFLFIGTLCHFFDNLDRLHTDRDHLFDQPHSFLPASTYFQNNEALKISLPDRLYERVSAKVVGA